MPRKSVDALTTRVVAAIGTCLPAPDGLSQQEAALWAQVVDSKPADWFDDGNAPLLKEYVRAAALCDGLAARIAETASEGPEYRRLLRLRDREAMRLSHLAMRMRLTQQAKYTPKSAATADNRATGKRPWGEGPH